MDEKAIQECIDKMAIKEVIAGYAICFDTGDGDGFAALFGEDGKLGGMSGYEQLRDFCNGVHVRTPDCTHITANHVIDVDGDKAHSVCELTAFMSRSEGVYTLCTGIYTDDFVKEGGKWRFANRSLKITNPEILTQGKIGEYMSGKK